MNCINHRELPQPGQLYKHFKNKLYQIVAIAEHSEDGEALVIYQALYGTFKVYARPLDMFLSEVDHEKYPEVAQKYRFERVCMESEQAATIDASIQKAATDAPAENPLQLDEGVWAFLDAASYEERYMIFTGMQHRLTDEMINIMAVSLDTEVSEGTLEERISSLKNFLQMQMKYECNRLR